MKIIFFLFEQNGQQLWGLVYNSVKMEVNSDTFILGTEILWMIQVYIF
jgi:hypothetical protein